MSNPPPSPAVNPKPRLVVLTSSAKDSQKLDPALTKFCADFGFHVLGRYQDDALGGLPVWAFACGDGKINLRTFSLPGRVRPVLEFESAFANGDCLVTTTAPVTGDASAWVDLFALDAMVPVAAAAAQHGNRLTAAEARAGAQAVSILDLESHFELRGRAEFDYELKAILSVVPSGVALSPEAIWYYNLAGERHGPVKLADLQTMARGGEFNASRDMAWMPDYPEWLRMREIPELAEIMPEVQLERPATPMRVAGESGDEIPLDEPEERFGDMLSARQDQGLGRFAFYVLVLLLIPGFAFGGHFAATRILNDDNIATVTAVAILVLGSLLAVLGRLKNLAMSGAWILTMPVPLVNIWLSYRLVVCPPGYAEHKRLGAGGIFLAILFWLSLVGQLAFGIGLATGKLSLYSPLLDPTKEPIAEQVNTYLALRTAAANFGGASNGGIRYESGSAGWRSVTYTYTVLDPAITQPGPGGATFEETMKPILTHAYLTDPAMKLMRENQVTVYFRYIDRDGQLIRTIPIKP